jgi:hypothetical protein
VDINHQVGQAPNFNLRRIMEIDLKQCKNLDIKHNYKHDPLRAKWSGGFHATCLKKFQSGDKIKSIARSIGSRQYYVKSALINIGVLDKKELLKRVPWDNDDIEIVRGLILEDKSFYTISKAIGRSIHSVSSLVKRIKNGSIYKVIVETKKATFKKCQCGFDIVSLKDQCNWCRWKNGSDRVA